MRAERIGPADSPAQARRTVDRETDFLIVGAGSGGCAAARILAQRTDARICLLESGGSNERPDVADPSRWAELLTSDAAWRYLTEPQAGAGGRRVEWAMGRVLGGSSSINGMKYMRGAPWDYDAWEAGGNPGWGAEEVGAVFRALERYPGGDEAVRGRSGPLPLERISGDHPLTVAFIEACAEAGFAECGDVNSLAAEGVGRNQLNVAGGRRADAATALLGELRDRIEIVTGATATEVIADRAGGRIEAVRCESAGGSLAIRVEREVLLAAGAIETPHLMLLSGIGPAAELAAAGVRPRLDLPGVGRNLHDHVGAPVVYESERPLPPSAYQGTEATLYLKSLPESEHYDAQVSMQLFPARLPDRYAVPAHGFSLFPGILKPRSRGSLRLRSANPGAPPVIDPAYLSEPDDVRRLCSAVATARRLVAEEPYDRWRAQEIGPGEDVADDGLEEYVRGVAATYYHPVGTCRMGPDPSRDVVDARLQVHGIENLRVADNSAMPQIISGNTNAPAMMIGWRAGEFAAQDLDD